MDTAILFADMSTCNRLKVGAVVVKNRRIVSSGYNGTPSGFYHCDETNSDLDYSKEEDRVKHHSFSEKFEIHAEMNAILDMAKRGLSPADSTLYITTAPCKNCAKLIIVSGITRVVYLNAYDREKISSPGRWDFNDDDFWYVDDMSGVDILRVSGIQVDKFEETVC